jgi:hypothetical protein
MSIRVSLEANGERRSIHTLPRRRAKPSGVSARTQVCVRACAKGGLVYTSTNPARRGAHEAELG